MLLTVYKLEHEDSNFLQVNSTSDVAKTMVFQVLKRIHF